MSIEDLPYEILGIITNYFETSKDIFHFILLSHDFYNFAYDPHPNYTLCDSLNFGPFIQFLPTRTCPFVKILKDRKKLDLRNKKGEIDKTKFQDFVKVFPKLRKIEIRPYSLLDIDENLRFPNIDDFGIVSNYYYGSENVKPAELLRFSLMLFPNLRRLDVNSIRVNKGGMKLKKEGFFDELEKALEKNEHVKKTLKELVLNDYYMDHHYVLFFLKHFPEVDSLLLNKKYSYSVEKMCKELHQFPSSVFLKKFLIMVLKDTNDIMLILKKYPKLEELEVGSRVGLDNFSEVINKEENSEVKGDHLKVLRLKLNRPKGNVCELLCSILNFFSVVEEFEIDNVSYRTTKELISIVGANDELNENPRLKKLYINYSPFPSSISGVLLKKFNNLRSLYLKCGIVWTGGNNNDKLINCTDIVDLKDVFPNRSSSLTEFSCLANSIRTESNVFVNLLRMSKKLKYVKLQSGLNFVNNRVSEKKLSHLANYDCLETVDFSGKTIHVESALQVVNVLPNLRHVVLENILLNTILVKKLKENSRVEHLRVISNKIDEKGLFDILKKFKVLKILRISHNKIYLTNVKMKTKKLVKILSECECVQNTLENLSIGYNNISFENSIALINTMKKLSHLDLRCCQVAFAKKHNKLIDSRLEPNTNLRVLSFDSNTPSFSLVGVEKMMKKFEGIVKSPYGRLTILDCMSTPMVYKDYQKLQSKYPEKLSCSEYNPCFTGDCLAVMANGSLKRVDDIRKNDIVVSNLRERTVSRVKCVLKTKIMSGSIELVEFESGLKITPWHPLKFDNEWRFPKKMEEGVSKIFANVDSIYSFVLEERHIMIINGYECVTLGHNFKDNDVIRHPYFGSKRVIEDLKELNGWNGGLIEVRSNCLVKDKKTGLVDGFRKREMIQC